jgi:hypothetical protein
MRTCGPLFSTDADRRLQVSLRKNLQEVNKAARPKTVVLRAPSFATSLHLITYSRPKSVVRLARPVTGISTVPEEIERNIVGLLQKSLLGY